MVFWDCYALVWTRILENTKISKWPNVNFLRTHVNHTFPNLGNTLLAPLRSDDLLITRLGLTKWRKARLRTVFTTWYLSNINHLKTWRECTEVLIFCSIPPIPMVLRQQFKKNISSSVTRLKAHYECSLSEIPTLNEGTLPQRQSWNVTCPLPLCH